MACKHLREEADERATRRRPTGIFDTLVRWSQLISLVAQSLTLGGSAVYVVFWLQNRR